MGDFKIECYSSATSSALRYTDIKLTQVIRIDAEADDLLYTRRPFVFGIIYSI